MTHRGLRIEAAQRGYLLTAAIEVPAPIEEVFEFFSAAENLQELTPPFLQFKVLTPLPVRMAVGTLIDYRIKVRGLPMRWRSEIAVWDPPHRFVDNQLRGPYRRWYHEHRFTSLANGGTLCEDRVEYSVLGGALVHRLLVRGDVERIFRYREQRMRELFAAPGASPPA